MTIDFFSSNVMFCDGVCVEYSPTKKEILIFSGWSGMWQPYMKSATM